ncbi:hypothetical protein MOUN0_O11606 [Monosporozyma unispora]
MLRGVWTSLMNKTWGSLSTVTRLSGNNKLGMLSRGVSFPIFQRASRSQLHLVYLNHFNPAKLITWRLTPVFYNANVHGSRFTLNKSANILRIDNKKVELPRSKFNINSLVNNGYYNGLWNWWLHTTKNPLFKLKTASLVNQLLDSLHRLHNSSYRRESIKLQAFDNNNQELTGAFIDFDIPMLNKKNFYNQESNLLNENTLLEMESAIASMKRLHENTSKIFESYGYLPFEKIEGDKLRIHFPNKTAIETERLISDLGIIEGMIHEQTISNVSIYNQDQSSCDDILSSSCNSSVASMEDELVYLNKFSPVLSQVSL